MMYINIVSNNYERDPGFSIKIVYCIELLSCTCNKASIAYLLEFTSIH